MPDFPSTKVKPLEGRLNELTRRMIEVDDRLKKLEAIKSQSQYRSHKTRGPRV